MVILSMRRLTPALAFVAFVAFVVLAVLPVTGCAGAEEPSATVDSGSGDGKVAVDSVAPDAVDSHFDDSHVDEVFDGRVDDAIFFDTTSDTTDVAVAEVDVDGGDASATDLIFPSATDPGAYVDSLTYQMSRKGNYVSGSRTTSLDGATGFATSLKILDSLVADSSGSGSLRLDVYLNDVKIGSVSIEPTTGDSVPVDFAFAKVSGPTYTIEYRAVNDVASGYGFVDLKMDVSHVVLR